MFTSIKFKVAFLLISIVSVFVVLPLSLFAADIQIELVVNGDMEQDTGWEANRRVGIALMEISKEEAFRGAFSLKVVTKLNARGIRQLIQLIEGKEYIFSAWIYPTEPGNFSIGMNNTDVEHSEDLTHDSWQQIKRTIIYKEQRNPGVYVLGLSPTRMTFYIDNVSVKEVIDEPIDEPIVTPIVTPFSTPIDTPIVTPTVTPTVTPFSTPIDTPLVTPIDTPIATPIVTPIATPIVTPIDTPIGTPFMDAINQPPVLEPIGDKSVDVGDALEFTVLANDPDGDILTYSISGLNNDTILNSSTGEFFYIPAIEEVGIYIVTFTVTDGIDFDSETITLTVVNQLQEKVFYVDDLNGEDNNNGSISFPFKTVSKALSIVSSRVNSGIMSDKIYMIAGTYRNDGFTTDASERDFLLYNINMKGTIDNYSEISAMPCDPGTTGCIQAKNGSWYEKVIFDDGYTIPSGIWSQINANIWKSNPGYLNSSWGTSHPDEGKGTGLSWDSGTNSDDLAIGPRMILQDDKPLKWQDPWVGYDPLNDPYDANPVVNPVSVLTEEGTRTYDQKTGFLYAWLYNNENPNNVKMESWKGLTPDVRFRHMFEGSMEFVKIKGIEFRLVTAVLGSGDTGNYQNVEWEGNKFSYCWKHLFSDFDDNATGAEVQTIQRDNWTVRFNIFYRPSREAFQIFGNNHIFEFNEIIEHIGPWAGGVARVSAVNTRHMNNAIIRFNYTRGHGNKWNASSVFMIESDLKQKDTNGDCMFNGQTFEYNFFGDMDGGTAIYLGRGGCRMSDITIQNNVFAFNRDADLSAGIRITSPHKNLSIINNVFYEQKDSITVVDDRGGINLESIENTISINNNIFMENDVSISNRLAAVSQIDSNLYFNIGDHPFGTNAINEDPLFIDPAGFNFTLMEGSPAIMPGTDIGAYENDGPIISGTEWWTIKDN